MRNGHDEGVGDPYRRGDRPVEDKQEVLSQVLRVERDPQKELRESDPTLKEGYGTHSSVYGVYFTFN